MSDKGIGASQKAQQEERLSKKHIQTLGYVQELMNENKKLREIIKEYEEQKLHCDELHSQNDAAQAKIKAMQEQCLAKVDDISASLVRQHEQEQMKLKEDKLNAERRLEISTREMAQEIERLQKLNASLEDAIKAKSSLASNQLELREQAEADKKQISNLQSKIKTLTEVNENQLEAMKKLDKELSQQKSLKERLGSANQMVKELEAKVKQLQSELEESTSALTALQDNEIKSYKSKLIKALNEVASLQEQLYTQQSLVEKHKADASAYLDELEGAQTKRFTLEREIEALKKEIGDLKQQLAKLKGKNEDSGTFKDFVAVKRELASLQEENQILKERLHSSKKVSSAGKSSKAKINLTLRQ